MNLKFGHMMAALGVCLLATAAQAQGVFRTYVASSGSDANPCTVAAPCRLLPAALNAVANGGEIWILDSANFNTSPVNITKNVYIKAIPGQVGSIVSFNGGPAITVAANTKLRLRNVAVVNNATLPGTDGIVVASGSRLKVEYSEISVVGTAIDVTGGLNAAGSLATIDHVTINGGTHGVVAHDGAEINVSNSLISGTSANAIWADGSLANIQSRIFVNDSTLSNNNSHLAAISQIANAGARVVATRCSMTRGQFGANAQVTTGPALAAVTVGYSVLADLGTAFHTVNGGLLESQGNNLVNRNGTDADGAVTNVGSF
jgi:hypothetical protein